jgi:hypothetical protein
MSAEVRRNSIFEVMNLKSCMGVRRFEDFSKQETGHFCSRTGEHFSSAFSKCVRRFGGTGFVVGVSCFVVVVLLLLSGSGSPTRDDDGDDNDDAREATDNGGSVVHRGRLVSGCLGLSACFVLLLSFVVVVVVIGIGTPAGDDDSDNTEKDKQQRHSRTKSMHSTTMAPVRRQAARSIPRGCWATT